MGRALVEVFSANAEVVGVSRSRSGSGWARADIREPAEFRRVLGEVRPDVVIHAAAYPEPDFCEEHPEEARRLNVETVATLGAALPDSARIVFISTDYVFDGTRPPYREDSERSPRSEYGRTKVAAEDLLAGRSRTVILRTGLQVGEGMSQNRRGFIRELVELLREGKPQQVDDVLMRFPTWTMDTASAAKFLVDCGAEGVFHVSGQRGKTRYGWALEIAEIARLSASHLTASQVVVSRRAERPLNSQLATTKIRGLGFKHFTDFADVVRKVGGL